MHATECGANTGVLFDEGDAAVKIATTEKNVIERRRKASNLGLSCPERRRDDRACAKSEKSSARDVLHSLLLCIEDYMFEPRLWSVIRLGTLGLPLLRRFAGTNVRAAALVLDFRRIGIALE